MQNQTQQNIINNLDNVITQLNDLKTYIENYGNTPNCLYDISHIIDILQNLDKT